MHFYDAWHLQFLGYLLRSLPPIPVPALLQIIKAIFIVRTFRRIGKFHQMAMKPKRSQGYTPMNCISIIRMFYLESMFGTMVRKRKPGHAQRGDYEVPVLKNPNRIVHFFIASLAFLFYLQFRPG